MVYVYIIYKDTLTFSIFIILISVHLLFKFERVAQWNPVPYCFRKKLKNKYNNIMCILYYNTYTIRVVHKRINPVFTGKKRKKKKFILIVKPHSMSTGAHSAE